MHSVHPAHLLPARFTRTSVILFLAVALGMPADSLLAQTNTPKSGSPLLSDEYPVTFGGDDQDYAEDIAVDTFGNTFVAGRFKETVDFDPGPGVEEHVSFGSDDAFLASYDEDGGFRYVVPISATGQDFASGVAVDASGNAFVTGRLVGTADFDPNPAGTFNLTGDGADGFDGDAFLASYDSQGALRFAFLLESSVDGEGERVSLDGAGNVYLLGRAYGGGFNSIEFDPDPVDISIRGFAAPAGYIASYDNMGDFRFAERIGGDADTSVGGFGIHTDATGTSWVTGGFNGTVDFDPDGDDTEIRTSALTGTGFDSRDVFVASYDNTGDFLSVMAFGGPGSDQGNSIAVNASGRMFVAGKFEQTVDFDPGVGVENLTSDDGSTDGFLASYDASGAFRFAFSVGGGGFDEMYDVGLDAMGYVYASGEFNDTVDFDPDPAGTSEHTVNVFDDIFVASYTADGDFRFVSVAGGPGRDEGLSIDVYPNGMSAVAGRFAETVDFDPDEFDSAFRTANDMAGFFGNGDAFVAKYDTDGSLVRGYQAPVGCDIAVRNTNDTGEGSLRQAILDANGAVGAETICFDIPGDGPHTIQPLSELPEVTDPVVIDGLTQQGAACTSWPPSLMVELDGSLAGAGADGLRVIAGSSTIRGLTVNRFDRDGIDLQVGGGNTIACNFLGTDITGTLDRGNGSGDGVDVKSSDNLIGRADGVMGNLASGSNNQGIRVAGADVVGNVVRGNRVGTDVSGTAALGNTFSGIIVDGASDTIIGGTAAADRNVISGNGWTGIYVTGTGASGTRIEGNYIGTDAGGLADLGNAGDGVLIDDGTSNTIGGSEVGAGNVISANGDDGIELNFGSADDIVQGNIIGLDATGTASLGNGDDGVRMDGSGHLIGGTTASARNVISGNGSIGIRIVGWSNRVEGNYIGTDITGLSAAGNVGSGIRIQNRGSNTIGGPEEGAGNVISANGDDGVRIFGSETMFTTIQGNIIGLAADGQSSLGNASDGVDLNNQVAFNTVADNVLSSNGAWGLHIYDGATDTEVYRNFIGTNAEGEERGNVQGGILVEDAGPQIIGGTYGDAGACCEGNTIAYNGGPGIGVDVVQAISHEKGLRGNRIYSNVGLGIDLELDGVTANDPQDTDGADAANALQNYPVLDVPQAGQTFLTGLLSSVPSSSFRLDLYRSPVCDPSGYGEGEFFLGTVDVETNASGDGLFTFELDVQVGPNEYYTATAIDASANTSEFSACVEPEAVDGPPSASVITAPADGATILVGGTGPGDAGDPNDTITVSWTASVDPEGADVAHTWQFAASEDFSTLLVEINAGPQAEINFTLSGLALLLDGTGVMPGGSVAGYHRVISGDGMLETAGPATEVTFVRGTITSTDANGETPEAYALDAAYPNPFNPSTTVGYSVPESGHVRIGVIDLLGREVRVLVDGMRPAGDHRAVFEAGSLPSGIYLIRMEAGGHGLSRQVTLMK